MYTAENSKIYSQLGILGTTYELSFTEMGRLLGDIREKTVLDFGTGTGRSARLLQSLGAKHVIGVEPDENMLAQARAIQNERLELHLITDNTIPLPDNSVDIAVSAHVFVEMATLTEMQQSIQEVARVLIPSGTFILITTNPASIGYEYKSYKYPKPPKELKNGDPIICLIKAEISFEITDTYWTVETYRQVLENAGFTQIQTTFPLAYEEHWLDEKKVAPDVVFACVGPHAEY